ncbi:heterogeneous nuclear ribonucleoproteins A1 homolog isoform X2 [Mizuhopecten yessoensis]|uniref:heterogeneous nuclear ribonucleoproteins A1 homolog isoform X2 n=1 Tax=Mizuhopecten yessoensis TaxID=6573 RepID=UPI000B45BAA2|nr:heterogeneous nuclear ribonucleoproteins A1 homolog isoform X2 [Mizuhopecten yessoensis]
MAETTENMDTSESITAISQDIDATINELSELVKDDAVVEDKEETKQDEDMEDSAGKKEGEEESAGKKEGEDSKAADDSKEEEKDSAEAKKKKKKPNVIDKSQRPPLVRVVQGEVIINKFKMKDAKMKDFLTILSKADSFVFEYNTENTQSDQTEENRNYRIGKITLTYSSKKDFKALSVINILADLVDFDSDIEITAPDMIRNELDAELYGIRRGLMSQAKDKTLYVNDITNATSEEFLRALVPDCTKAHIPVDSEGNKLGWAVLEFRNAKEADECMKTVKEIELGTDNKVVISRAESSDPADVAKAKELHKNKPPKRKKAVQTPAKDKKRQWNQGPGMLGPRPLMSPKGGNMGRGWSQGGGMFAGGDMRGTPRKMNSNGGFGNKNNPKGASNKPRPHTAGMQGRYGNQGSFGGNQGSFGGKQGFGNQTFGNRNFGNQEWGNQGYERQGGYQEDNYGGGRGNVDDDNMLDFLQSAIIEMKNKKSVKQQSMGDGWGGSGAYSSGYSQYEGFEDNPKRRRDNWNDSSDKNWGSGRSNQGNRGQQQHGLGVWKTQGGNQHNRNDGGRSGGKNYSGGYGGGQYDSYSSYSGRY